MIETFTSIRKATIVCLIAATAVFALLAVLGIWEITDREVLGKSFFSLVVIAVTSGLIIIAALVGEGRTDTLTAGKYSFGRPRSVFGTVISVIVGLMLLSWLLGGLRYFF